MPEKFARPRRHIWIINPKYLPEKNGLLLRPPSPPSWPTLSCLLRPRTPRHLGPSRGSRFYPWPSPYPLPLPTGLCRLSPSERITLTLAHFLLPLFHFAASDLPPPLHPDPSATRPSPTLDGTDLIGRVFIDPDLGLCRVVEVGPPHRLAPGEGNLDPTKGSGLG